MDKKHSCVKVFEISYKSSGMPSSAIVDVNCLQGAQLIANKLAELKHVRDVTIRELDEVSP